MNLEKYIQQRYHKAGFQYEHPSTSTILFNLKSDTISEKILNPEFKRKASTTKGFIQLKMNGDLIHDLIQHINQLSHSFQELQGKFEELENMIKYQPPNNTQTSGGSEYQKVQTNFDLRKGVTKCNQKPKLIRRNSSRF